MKNAKILVTVLALCSIANVASAGSDAPAENSESPKSGVLCAVWFLQRAAEQAGIIDESVPSIASHSYPVPAPVWVVENLLAVNRG